MSGVARSPLGQTGSGNREVVDPIEQAAHLLNAPIRESFLRYAPIDDIPAIRGCAMLIIDAEMEELFDIRQHGLLAF